MKFFILALLYALPALPITTNFNRTFGYCEKGGALVNVPMTSGSTGPFMASYPNCTVTVYQSGTQSLATLFSDNSNTPLANPFTADDNGLWYFYTPNGHYDISFSGSGINVPYTWSDIPVGNLSLPALSGDVVSAPGSSVVTVTGTNGLPIPANQSCIGTNGAAQVIAGACGTPNPSFSTLTSGTNTTMNGILGTGSVLMPAGSGVNQANEITRSTFTSLPSAATASNFLYMLTDNITSIPCAAGSSLCYSNGSNWFQASTPGANSTPPIPFTKSLSGTVTASVPTSIVLAPCPLGVSGSDAAHYLYLVGGGGVSESVLMTGGTCTSGAVTGTIGFTSANTHTGTWTLSSATAGFQEAVNYYGSNALQVLAQAGIYTLYAPVTVKGYGVNIAGVGQNATQLICLIPNGTNCFNFTSASINFGYGQPGTYNSLRNLTIAVGADGIITNVGPYGITPNTNSTGYAVNLVNQLGFQGTNLLIRRSPNGIYVGNSDFANITYSLIQDLYPGTGRAIRVDSGGTDLYLDHLTVAGTNTFPCGLPCEPFAGIDLENTGNPFMGYLDVFQTQYGLLFDPGTGHSVSYAEAIGSTFDQQALAGIALLTQGGSVNNTTLNGVWTASTVDGILTNTTGGGTIQGLTINGGTRSFNNFGNGINLLNGSDINIGTGVVLSGNNYQTTGTCNTGGNSFTPVSITTGNGLNIVAPGQNVIINGLTYTIAAAGSAGAWVLTTAIPTQSGVSFSYGTPNNASGIAVGAGVSGLTIQGVRSGMTSAGLENSQGYGVYLSAGATNHINITNNDLRGNTSAGLANAGVTGTDINVSGNLGYNPVGQSSISVGASPYTYTAGISPETVFIWGGTTTSVNRGATQIASGTSNISVALPPKGQLTVLYSGAAPTMVKDVQ